MPTRYLYYLAVVTFLSTLPAGATPGRTESIACLQQSYSSDELREVRDWENTWAGEKITGDRIDDIADFLPSCLVRIYKNPADYGAPENGFYFVVGPYRHIDMTPGRKKATETYAASVKVNDEGMIENYDSIAGIPFPEPKTGRQVAWNFDFNTRGDSSCYRRYTPSMTIRSGHELVQDADCWELFFAHRVDVDPRPVLPRNRKRIHWAGFYHLYKPNELLNTRRFNIRYLDFERDDDNYMYNAQTRRLSRLSGVHRTDSVDGSIVIYDDEYCWNGQINRNTYTLIGRKEFLAARNIDAAALERRNGQVLYNNLIRERINTYAVEVVSKDPKYIYGKRIWYVDPETYAILCTQIYDRHGKFWKFIEQFGQNITTAQQHTKNYLVGCHVIDYQRGYAACTRQTVKGIGITVQPELFTMSSLQRSY